MSRPFEAADHVYRFIRLANIVSALLRVALSAIVATIAIVLSMNGALAQGFQVKPMLMNFSAPAGRVAETILDLTNTSSGPLSLQLYSVDLTQSPVGTWQMVMPESGFDISKLSSALAWTQVSTDLVEVPAATTARIPIRFNIPAQARGTYIAGIIAEQPTPANAESLVVRVRFLIPVIIQIQGRPVRQNISLSDIAMERVSAAEGTTATTNLTMKIVNDGLTYSRVRGQLALEADVGGDWRTVTRIDVAERGIIPGSTLELPADIQRRLPSGTYRLRAELFVDGRRVAPLEREIVFEGDPEIDELALDTALVLEPTVVSLDVVPGATRTAILTVENPGTEAVDVELLSGTPKALSGVVMGDLRGTDLSAQPWTEIRPSTFTLRPGRRQNVRVISRIPDDGEQFPNYYADLVLEGTYQDGQSAGETRSMVHLVNRGVPGTTNAVVEQFELAQGNVPGEFFAQVRLVNVGTVDVEPAPTLTLLTPRGQAVMTTSLTGEPGILLPLGIRTYGGNIDLKDVEPGLYLFRVHFPLSVSTVISDQRVVLIESGEMVTAEGETVSAPQVTLNPDGAEIDLEVGKPEAPTVEGGDTSVPGG